MAQMEYSGGPYRLYSKRLKRRRRKREETEGKGKEANKDKGAGEEQRGEGNSPEGLAGDERKD